MIDQPFRVLDPNESYTFSSYFGMVFAAEDILKDLGFTLVRERLDLPTSIEPLSGLDFLVQYLERNLSHVTPVSEISRREVLIAPVLLEVCSQVNAQLSIEYAIRVSNWLKGSLDYFITAPSGLVVIEAKQADLSKGFLQLAVELIALDQWIDQPDKVLWGAVTTGDLWKFGYLDRTEKRVIEDRTIYRVPDDLESVFRTLVAIVQGLTHSGER